MRFTDTASITGTHRTADGYLVAEVRCARTGCQEYLGSEIGLSDAKPLTVYRPEKVVFSRDSLATYAGKPVTVGHPADPVTADNWKRHAVGEVGDEVARDGEFVRVGIMVRDADAIRAIEEGTREISMGYTTPIEHRDGVSPDGTPYQAVQAGPIRINHLALVDRARGGDKLRVGDGAGSWGAAPQPTQKEDAMPETLRTIVVDGLSIQVTDQGAQAIEKLNKQLGDRDSVIADRDSKIEDLQKKLDTQDGELAATKKQLEDATSPAALSAAVRNRSALLDMAEKKGKKKREDYEDMDDAAIRRDVVSEHLGDTAKNMSDDAISGAFLALGDRTSTSQSMQIRTQDADPWAVFVPQKKEA